MEEGESYWDKMGQLEVGADILREAVSGDFDSCPVGAAEADVSCRIDNRQALRLDADEIGADGFAGD